MRFDRVKINEMDMQKFIELLDKTQGTVFLVTDDGDKINLQSKLSQLLGLRFILDTAKISSAELEFTNPEDETMFFRANLFGE